MKKILFIASLNTKKQRFDGERIKSTIMFESLKKLFLVDVINLSIFKLFNTLRIIFIGLFCKNKYDSLIISKDPHGANIIIKLLRLTKYPLNKVLYFEIGPFLYDRILNGTIKKENFENIKIIVETKSMKSELESIGVRVFDVFPNFKKKYNTCFVEQTYPKDTLNIIYFSRIDEMKGIYDLMEAVTRINQKKKKFNLDIYGKFSINFDENRFEQLISNDKGISYIGKLDLIDDSDYNTLSKYDLHVFPTKYSEGFPGTIIDFFIAGVPTLSSTFARAYDILSYENSFFFESGSNSDLERMLNYIYDNQNQLINKRHKSYEMREQFTTDRFEEYCKKII